MKKIIFLFVMMLSVGLYAQDMEAEQNQETIDSLAPKVKRLSVGVKIGVPNIAGLSVEAVTPLLDNRIAAFADFSGFNVSDQETEIGLNYSEFGLNVYLGKKGSGLYAGIGAGNLSTDLTFYENLDGGGRGKGTTGLDIKTTNLKLGIKTGGRIYFRFEVGYGVTSDIPENITVTLEEIGGSGRETESFEVPTIPGVGTNGVLVGNFGFGFSF